MQDTERARVAALYVERGGPYFAILDVDPWGRERDARTYAGPLPIVAHPPCGPWGRLRHLYRGNEHDCAPAAVAAARRWGGVVEHPAHSLLWAELDLPRPGGPTGAFGGFADSFGGYTIEVDQVAWGHVARKRSWLYLVGVPRFDAFAGVRTGGTPTHWTSGFHGHRCRQHGRVGCCSAPAGIKICSAPQRRRTPPAFAVWLVQLATLAAGG